MQRPFDMIGRRLLQDEEEVTLRVWRGELLTCATCEELIEADDRRGLIDRIVPGLILGHIDTFARLRPRERKRAMREYRRNWRRTIDELLYLAREPEDLN